MSTGKWWILAHLPGLIWATASYNGALVEINARTGEYGPTWLTVPADKNIDNFSIDPSGQWILFQVSPLGCGNNCGQGGSCGTGGGACTINVLHDGVSTRVAAIAGIWDPVW